MDINMVMQNISVMAIPILLAITLHEAGHAYAAYKLGDDTAYKLGRVSMNPLVHIDPVGTVLLPAAMILLNTGFVFGYAKPVPVYFGRLNNPRRDTMIVAFAGPAANLFLAVMGALILKLSFTFGFANAWLVQSLGYLILFNCLIAVFNMLPVPPLDGGRILMELVPYNMRQSLANLERFGIFIVLAVVLMFNQIITVPMFALYNLITGLFGLR